ncbi:MAG: PAS domain S-box protein, partial [Calditrichia bacterium]|nr:PAS domain S-box protein [Calditrichia bacterium]
MKSENNKTKIQLMGEIAELKNKLSAKNKELLKQKKINQTFQNKNEELEEQIIEQSFIENNISDFIYRHDINGIFYYLSPTVEKITGYSLDEWGNHYTTYLTDNPINEKVKEYTEATLATGEINPPYRIELFHKNGTPIILEINERPYFHHNKVAGIVGVARDITKKIKQEKELAESRDKISRLINNLPGIVYRCKNDKDW